MRLLLWHFFRRGGGEMGGTKLDPEAVCLKIVGERNHVEAISRSL